MVLYFLYQYLLERTLHKINHRTKSKKTGKKTGDKKTQNRPLSFQSIVVTGVTSAIFSVASIGANCVVNSAFCGALETGFTNRTAQIIANLALGGNISIVQGIFDLF